MKIRLLRRLIALAFVIYCTGTLQAQKYKYDKNAGSEGAKQVLAQMGLVNNPVTEAYINKIGQRLVSELAAREFDYTFRIVDMMEPNAFALPGGHIYISRGLLAVMNSEDEIAGVLSHEIIHSSHRHSYKQMKKSIFPALLRLPGSIIGAVNEDVGALINAPLDVASRLRLARYSRKHEYEADEFGIQLVAKAGYDPMALAQALQIIADQVEMLTGKKKKFSYFDTHPFTSNRLGKIAELSKTLTPAARQRFAKTRTDLYHFLEGLYFGQNPEQGVFRNNIFYHADLDISITFPENWNGNNNPQYVGAKEPKGKAMIIWGVLGINANPHELAEAYISKMKKKYEIEAYKSEKMNINGFDAYMFAVDEVSGRDINNITVLWLNKNGLIFQMIATGKKKFEKDFIATATSFHALRNEEKPLVAGTVLRVASARADETLAGLSKRTENVLQASFLALINRLDEAARLKAGQPVKFGRVEVYTPVGN
ncbi:MAG: M48 family metalloprotease [Bacteroidetes bacterium]|nr:M48 family metalloprotease [Bacteroidota bacterium]